MMFDMDRSRALQRDVYSLMGEADQKLFTGWKSSDAAVERARGMVAGWDRQLTKDSVPAAIYITWRKGVDRSAGNSVHQLPKDAVEASLKQALDTLTRDLGADWSQWRYGRVHTQAFPHPLLTAFDLPMVERRGGNGAVGADGASYREIIDVSNWDRSITVNTPGQSGQPGSPYYGNFLPIWEKDEYVPMSFSRGLVDSNAEHRLMLQP